LACGGGAFNRRTLAGDSPCRCWHRRRPGSGQWPGRLVAGSVEPPASDESNSLALRFPAVARGGGGGGGHGRGQSYSFTSHEQKFAVGTKCKGSPTSRSFKNSARTAKKTPHFTITKISWLTLFK
jgi:hypothetical protein